MLLFRQVLYLGEGCHFTLQALSFYIIFLLEFLRRYFTSENRKGGSSCGNLKSQHKRQIFALVKTQM